jgi:hypothetical protein
LLAKKMKKFQIAEEALTQAFKLDSDDKETEKLLEDIMMINRRNND